MNSSIEDAARMETLNEITEMVTEKGGGGMETMVMGMQALMAIGIYEKKLLEKTQGVEGVSGLISAIENGGFTDENGTKITDTITFKQLKTKLCGKEE